MKTKHLALTAIFTAVMIVLSQIAVPIPGAAAPISLSVGAIFLTGAVLPKRYALYSQLLYLLMGLVGLPVFANFSSGIGRIFGPTGGYLVAYPVMVFFVAWIPELMGKKNFATLFLGAIVSLVICYLLGTSWYTVVGHVGWIEACVAAVLPFIVFDLIKAGLFLAAGLAVEQALKKARLLNETSPCQ